MGYDSNVIQAAKQQLDKRKNEREAEFHARQNEIYKNIPRIAEIDRELRITISSVAVAALRKGTDPSQAIASLKKKNLSLQSEREHLLVEHGYSPHALNYQPYCTLCDDNGWRGAEMCQCLKDLCAKEQIRQLSSLLDLQGQSFENFRLDLYSDQPFDGYGSFSPRQNMEYVYDICLHYANEFPDSPYFKNLFLTGSTGLGKTFLSASIARVVSEHGYSVVYDTALNVFAQFESSKFDKDSVAYENTQRYLHCDLLILDDLGSEMRTSFTQSVLYEIVNTRLINNICTVISSNMSLSQIQQNYSPQIFSRIAGKYRSLSFYGEDIRLINKNSV